MKVLLYIIPLSVIATACWLTTSGRSGAQPTDSVRSVVVAIPDDHVDDKTPLQRFMREKLNASNSILEGLVTDDMQAVTEGANDLLKISHAEQWRTSTDMLYLQHSKTYRMSVRALQDKARKKSADGVALAWMDVTLDCIRCHEWVRNVMIADVPDLSPLPNSGDIVP